MTLLSALELLLPAGLAICMAMAALGDIRHYRIPNKLCAAVAAGALALMVVEALLGAEARLYADPVRQLWTSLIIAAVIFAGSTGLFAAGVMGGGDVKLLTATTLWAGPQLALPFLFITALVGGVVSLVVLVRTKWAKAQETSPNLNSLDTTIEAPKVPYGLGIAAGGLYTALHLVLQTGRLF